MAVRERHEQIPGGGNVRDVHADRQGRAGVAGRITGDCGEGAGAVGRGRAVPRDGVRGRGVFGAEVGPVDLELNAHHPHVVQRAGRDGDGTGHGRAGGRRGDGHRRRHRVGDRAGGRKGAVRDGHGDGRRRGGVAGPVAGDRGEGVGAVAGGGGVPGGGVGSRGVFRAEVGPIELELHPGDAHVVGRIGGDRDAAGYRPAGARIGDGRRRRRGVGRGAAGRCAREARRRYAVLVSVVQLDVTARQRALPEVSVV